MKHLMDTYLARDDWGRTYTIYVYGEARAMGAGDAAAAESTPELRTAEGDVVRRVSPGVYEVQGSGRRLWVERDA